MAQEVDLELDSVLEDCRCLVSSDPAGLQPEAEGGDGDGGGAVGQRGWLGAPGR